MTAERFRRVSRLYPLCQLLGYRKRVLWEGNEEVDMSPGRRK